MTTVIYNSNVIHADKRLTIDYGKEVVYYDDTQKIFDLGTEKFSGVGAYYVIRDLGTSWLARYFLRSFKFTLTPTCMIGFKTYSDVIFVNKDQITIYDLITINIGLPYSVTWVLKKEILRNGNGAYVIIGSGCPYANEAFENGKSIEECFKYAAEKDDKTSKEYVSVSI